MKKYLSTLWKLLMRWSSTSWKSGYSGKANVIAAWGILVILIASCAMLLMPDVELELRPRKKQPALLCGDEKTWGEILAAGDDPMDKFGSRDPSNQALLKQFNGRPEEQQHILSSDFYKQREAVAFRSAMHRIDQEIVNKITRGECVEVTHGDPVKILWASLKHWERARDTELIWVRYQGKQYRSYAGEWQRATGVPVAAQDRAPFRVPRTSQERGHYAPAPVENESAQAKAGHSPAPSFAQNEPYGQVREALLRDGWQPVISEDADECREDDARCHGRPEMQSCSGSGLAMCRFEWKRGDRRLSICTHGEDMAMFNNVCGYK